MKDIAKNIRQQRDAKGMTQDELAEKLFVTRQTVSNYETGKSRPDVEMLVKIAEILETDVHYLIYGPAPEIKKAEHTRLFRGSALTILFCLLYAVLSPITRRYAVTTFDTGWWWSVEMILRPVFFLFAGWTLMQLLGMAMKWKPLTANWARWAGRILFMLLAAVLILTLWYGIAVIVNHHLYINHIRGEWIEDVNLVNGMIDRGWRMLPAPVPGWVSGIVGWISYHITEHLPFLYPPLGAALWYLGFPKKKDI